MAHLLNRIPYAPKELPQVKLPKRQSDAGYVRPPREIYTYVPDHAATLVHPGR
jgi:polyphosphate kinase